MRLSHLSSRPGARCGLKPSHFDFRPFLRLLPIALALLSLAGCRGDWGNIFDIY